MNPPARKAWPKWRVLAWSMQFSLKAGAITAAEAYFLELMAYLTFVDDTIAADVLRRPERV